MADSPNTITLPIRSATKFGDADVASKRRKSPTHPENDDDDEYNTLFTKRLTTGSDLNSTTCHDEPDFTGGLVSPSAAKSSTPSHDPWQPHELLSPTPSASSRGFENTFKVLESQMRSTTSQLTPSQVNQVLRDANLKSNPIFLNVPFGARDRFLRAISEERGSVAGDEDVELAEPSLLELELDARQRIREIELEVSNARTPADCERTIPAESSDPAECSSMTEFLYGIPIHGCEPPSERIASIGQEEVVVAEDEGEYPEYVYHMARGKDKRVYLRVVRSLLVDKGNGER